MYGLDNNILPPPFSLIVSFFLIAGCDQIGIWALRCFNLPASGLRQWGRWQAPVLGFVVLAIILYPLALANLTPRMFMQGVGIFIGLLGMLHIVRGIPNCKSYWHDLLALISDRAEKLDAWGLLFVVLIVGAALLAMGPVTSHDSLSYHIGVPITLLNSGGMPVRPDWFGSRLAGSGEVLNAIGLAVGSEQFSSLIEFAALMGITGLLLCAEPSNEDKGQAREGIRINRLMALVALVTPDMLSELCSSKPQVLPVAMTSLALALLIFPSRRHLSSRDSILNFVLVCMLLMVASQIKLAFLLSGGVLGLLAMIIMVRQSLLLPAMAVGAFLAVLIMAPHVIWNMHYFHAGFIDALTKPMPGPWPGGEAFDAYAKNATGIVTSFPYPLSIILPSGVDSAAHVLGIGALFLFFVRPNRDPWLWGGLIAALAVLVGVVFLAPWVGRYYLEPYFWCMLLLAMSPSPVLIRTYPWFKWGVLAQSACVLIVMYFGVFALFPGGLTPQWREKIMNRSANGYMAMQWADKLLPKNAVVLTDFRSMALVPRSAVSMNWMNFAPVETEAYLNLIKERGPNYILLGPTDTRLSGCYGKLVAKAMRNPFGARNPFNRTRYQLVRLYEFHADQLPGCAYRKGK